MRILISEGQLENLKKSVNKGEDIDERSRSFAFTRKKRLFSKPERMSNPLRYKFIDRLEEEKFLTCKNCRKKFTQTTHQSKKSLPICPWCGTHNK